MKRYLTLTIGLLLLISLTLSSCKQDPLSCTDDEAFCALVAEQNFEATGPIIDDFLSGLRKNQADENLNQLVDWLECKSCVDNIKLLCNSCIQTLPVQSELQVDFIANGQAISLILDISMDDILAFNGYH